jgi:hypothetical protein
MAKEVKEVIRRNFYWATLSYCLCIFMHSAEASHYLVMSPVSVYQRYVIGLNTLEVRASTQVGGRLLSALNVRVNGRAVIVPAAGLRSIEWPDLTNVELRKSSDDATAMFISIQCACGRKDNEEAQTAIIQFKNLSFIGVSIEPAED